MKYLALFFLLCNYTNPSHAEIHDGNDPSWSFLVMADTHFFEFLAQFNLGNKDYLKEKRWEEGMGVMKGIQQSNGGDLVMLPGDMVSFGGTSNQELAAMVGFEEPTGEAIYTASINSHKGAREFFNIAGYDTVLAAVGDHELGGNKGFRTSGKNSKLSTVPDYRNAFGDGYNKDSNGRFLFEKPIGNATSTPIGTEFNETSFAYVHKNVLFVTLDAFRMMEKNYIDRKKGYGGEGAITCDVSGKHLEWFESVLVEGEKDPAIKYMFVQSHLPILNPVRKVKTSGQFMDGAHRNELWKLMSKYGVDIYFAGDVHGNTASMSKAPGSQLVQIVSRGNRFSNFLNVVVNDDKVDITLFNEIGSKPKYNGDYETYGRLTIDKSNTTDDSSPSIISSSGELALIDVDSAIIQFNFEEIFPLDHRQVPGLIGEDSLIPSTVNVRGIECSESILNQGTFGSQYDAQVVNINLVPGRKGDQLAASFGSDSRFAIFGVGPYTGGVAVSFSLWIKTTNKDLDMILVHYGGSYGGFDWGPKDQMTLALERGVPVVYTKRDRKLGVVESMMGTNNIADDKWHHISVSMPKQSCLLSEIQIYIDGNAARTSLLDNSKDYNIFQVTSGRMAIGGFGSTSSQFDRVFPNLKPYEGLVSSFSMWSRPLRMEEETKYTHDYWTECNKQDASKFKEVPIRLKKHCNKKCALREKCRGYEVTTYPALKCLHFRDIAPSSGGKRQKTACGRKETVSVIESYL